MWGGVDVGVAVVGAVGAAVAGDAAGKVGGDGVAGAPGEAAVMGGVVGADAAVGVGAAGKADAAAGAAACRADLVRVCRGGRAGAASLDAVDGQVDWIRASPDGRAAAVCQGGQDVPAFLDRFPDFAAVKRQTPYPY